ncbi:hypothetical protein BKA67DRAFT_571225 [Truncatella angustata]|uniref:Uncharacterized protein n=1 Tax=Truncatella angustata TaxID=152316 RepID=A0A9P8UG73_9PEZI|nr:uncharacterized protein BKA67DRAFT_571225 [Truncatella angustata]KAH6651560.1 hypothetical protein BKA67DRAFT_571225 [Truncatella angustata]
MKTLIRSHNPARLSAALPRPLFRPGVSASTRISSTPFTSHPSHRQRRSFHLGVAPVVQTVGQCFQTGCQTAQDVMLAAHGLTGMPWVFTIPLFALGVNLLFRLPFNLQNQVLIQRRSKVAHVLQGWFRKHWQEVSREQVPPGEMKKELEKRAKPQAKRLYRALGLQQWKFYLIGLGIPFWLMSLEAIRRLCGAGRFGLNSSDAGPATSDTATRDLSQRVVDTSDAALRPVPDASAASDVVTNTAQIVNAAQPMDPTLTSEGLLWFTDLTVADPYYILPITFTALTVLNIIPKDKTARQALFGRLSRINAAPSKDSNAPPSTETMDLGSNWRIRTIRAILLSSPGLIILTGSFPAAVHLYTITSVLATMLTRAILSKMYPVVAKAETCKHREMPVIRPALPKLDIVSKEAAKS